MPSSAALTMPPAYPAPAYGYPAYGYPPNAYPPPGYGPYGPPPPGYPPPQAYAPPGDEYPTKKRGVFLSPLDVLGSGLVGEFAFAVSTSTSLNLRAGYRYRATRLTFWDSTSYTAMRAQSVLGGFGAQFFLFEKAFNRLYIMTDVEYARTWTTGANANIWAAGVKVGYQWTWPGGFSMRFGGGAGYYEIDLEGSGLQLGVSGLLPTLEFLIGWTS